MATSCNAELLKYVFKNAQMGRDSIDHVLKAVEDKEFEKLLKEQQQNYDRIERKAKESLQDYNEPAEDLGAVAQTTSALMIKMKTLTDKTPSHLAEMMIQGSTMGIIDIHRRLNQCDDYADLDSDVRMLGQRLLELEEGSVEQLKKYL